MKNMTDEETANHLCEWVKKPHGPFAWATDGCGYDQHIKFVCHRNKNYCGQDFKQFILDYADSLVGGINDNRR